MSKYAELGDPLFNLKVLSDIGQMIDVLEVLKANGYSRVVDIKIEIAIVGTAEDMALGIDTPITSLEFFAVK